MSGDRFFARLRAAVLECPAGCGRLYELRPSSRDHVNTDLASKQHWDPLTGRFSCPGCGGTFQLGIVAHELTRAESATIPADWRPSIPQARWMRDQARGWAVGRGKGAPPIEAANQLVGEAWPDPAAMGVDLPPDPPPARPGRRRAKDTRAPMRPAANLEGLGKIPWRQRGMGQAVAAATNDDETEVIEHGPDDEPTDPDDPDPRD